MKTLKNKYITTPTPPGSWALSREEAKAHLSILDSSFDTIIDGYISSAHAALWVECNVLISGVYKGYLDDFETFRITTYPYSTMSVVYRNTAGADITMTEGTEYIVRGDNVVKFLSTPTRDNDYPIEVTVANGTTDDDSIKQALRMLVADMFESRQSDVKGALGRVSRGTFRMLRLIDYNEI